MVDDEILVLDLITLALRTRWPYGYRQSDPLAELERARQFPIDILVTDVDMKPISGFELVKRLGKTGWFNGPVLFTSGYPADSEIVAGSLGNHAILESRSLLHNYGLLYWQCVARRFVLALVILRVCGANERVKGEVAHAFPVLKLQPTEVGKRE